MRLHPAWKTATRTETFPAVEHLLNEGLHRQVGESLRAKLQHSIDERLKGIADEAMERVNARIVQAQEGPLATFNARFEGMQQFLLTDREETQRMLGDGRERQA